MFRLLLLFLLIVLVGGCATDKKVNWSTRLNNYTYDQAVVELGPPDKSAKLTDGTTIAEWYQRRSAPSFGIGTGVGHGPVALGVGLPVTGSDVRIVRLTFDPQGVLRSTNQKQ